MDAADRALAQVSQVRDDPVARVGLAARTYLGPYGRAPRHLPFRRAAVSFMTWQLRRGVLDPPHRAGDRIAGGSAWWRACNERLLRDGCEAVARGGGFGGPPSARSVEQWMRFVTAPTARHWYRAHNASIVSAYLDHGDLAALESQTERFFLNLILCRVLYAHALTEAPRLALSWLAPAGRLLGDPRLGAVGVFLSVRRVVPVGYPPEHELGVYLNRESLLGRLLDHGLVVPRLSQLYDWSARALGEPRLRDLLDPAGRPCYVWTQADPDVWHPPRSHALLPRLLRQALPAGSPG